MRIRTLPRHPRCGTARPVPLRAGACAGDGSRPRACCGAIADVARVRSVGGEAPTRSEEHTSELQSLMRISYAVFCLKKKKTNKLHKNQLNKSNDTTNLTT